MDTFGFQRALGTRAWGYRIGPRCVSKPLLWSVETKINSEQQEKYLEENSDLIFHVLIEQKFAKESDIMVFNIIKEHKNKIINWILPSKKSDLKMLSQIENDKNLLNTINDN